MLANPPFIDPSRGDPPGETRVTASRVGVRGWLSSLLLVALVAWPCCLRSAGALDEAPEYELKAAFLYNFAKFVTWPTNAFETTNSPLYIGILGEDPSKGLLEGTLANRPVNGRKITIKPLKAVDSFEGYHMLFISSSEKEVLPSILSKLQGKSILTVSETVGEFKEFAYRGGMINLFIDQRRVRFEINPEAAKKCNLMISSKLGALGILVKTKEATGSR